MPQFRLAYAILIALAYLSLGVKGCSSDNRPSSPNRRNSAPRAGSNTTNNAQRNEGANRNVQRGRLASGVQSDGSTGRKFSCSNLSTTGTIVGVTITSVNRELLSKSVERLKEIGEKSNAPVVTRIVFDPIETKDEPTFNAQLEEYRDYAKAIHDVSCVMGEIGDSHDLYKYLQTGGGTKKGKPPSGLTYEEWTKRLTAALNPNVDIWEIGNELNGGWTGWKCDESGEHCSYTNKSTIEKINKQKEVLQATRGAYEAINQLKAEGKIKQEAVTALTLYYNEDEEGHQCAEYDEARMKTWLNLAGNILGDELTNNIGLVLLSFYEADCPDIAPTDEALSNSFSRSIRSTFRGERTGFGLGEIGFKDNDCTDVDDSRVDNEACLTRNAPYIERYYTTLDKCIRSRLTARASTAPSQPSIRYVGGYFYWWFLQDMVISTSKKVQFGASALEKAAGSFGGIACPSS